MLYAVWNKFLYVRRILTSYEKKGPFYCFQKQNKASSQPLGGKSAMYCAVYFCKAENPASCKQCRIPWSTVLYQLMLQAYTAVQFFDKGLCLSTSSWMAKRTALVAGWLGKGLVWEFVILHWWKKNSDAVKINSKIICTFLLKMSYINAIAAWFQSHK